MYTMAGEDYKCENKDGGAGRNFVLACLASGATHAYRRCSDSISDKTIVPSGNLISSVASFLLVLPIYVSPIVGGPGTVGGGVVSNVSFCLTRGRGTLAGTFKYETRCLRSFYGNNFHSSEYLFP